MRSAHVFICLLLLAGCDAAARNFDLPNGSASGSSSESVSSSGSMPSTALSTPSSSGVSPGATASHSSPQGSTDAGPALSTSAPDAGNDLPDACVGKECNVPSDGGPGPEPTTTPAAPGELGSVCDDGAECDSTYCVDGRCCEDACDGVCARCDAPGDEGTCTATQSDDQCAPLTCATDTECMTFSSDSLDQNCLDVGVCRTDAQCTSQEVTGNVSCLNGTGTCTGGECIVPNKKNLGESCTAASECGTNNCAAKPDGSKVCCSDACDGICEACGDDGVCSQAPADDARCTVDCSPSDQCTLYPASPTTNRCNGFRQCLTEAEYCVANYEPTTKSCGTSYYCDGQGGCVFRDTAAPFVSSSTPQNNASAVDTAVVIDVQFSEAMNTSSTSGATLSGPSGSVAATVSWSGNNHLLVSPNSPLLLLGDYTLTLTNAFKDTAGNALSQTTVSFRTRDGAWEASPTLIETVNTGDATNEALVVDGNRKVTAVWYQQQTGGAVTNLRSNQYGTTWGSSIAVESGMYGVSTSAVGGVDSSGKVRVLWYYTDGSTYTAQSSTLSNGSWSAPSTVYSAASINAIDFSTNASGNGLACIVTYDSAAAADTEYTVRTANYSAANGWSAVTTVAAGVPYTSECKVAVDSSGNAVLLWEQNGRARTTYRSNGGSWGAASDLDSGQTTGGYLALSVDGTGTFWAMWRREASPNRTMHARRKASGGGAWSSVQNLTSQNGGDVYWTQIVGDGLGNAMAIWYEYGEATSQEISIQAAYYNGSWSQSTSLSDDTGDSRFPAFAFDSRGNGMLVWSQPTTSSYYQVARRYVKGQGWGSPYNFNAPTNPTAFNQSSTVVIDSLGVATTVWSQFDGTRTNMWALRFK